MPPPTLIEPKRVLFVDDDRDLLDGLRDALRPYRRRWTMSFAISGDDALAMLEQEPQDIVVSDLRMPGMDGATLLARVREGHPATVRIILSGHAELRMVARAAGVAHRLLAKPCEIDELARVIERSCELKDITARVELSRRIAGTTALPPVPRLYDELTELLRGGDAGAEDAARILERDVAMAAKVLQLANSAYFGRGHPVTGVREAVAYLGLQALRALALSAEVFKQFPIEPPIPGFDFGRFEEHSTRVARLAHAIRSETAAGEDTFAAGLLHDVGMLVLAIQERDKLVSAIAEAEREHLPVYVVEEQRHGVTHADVGAYLLALWGLPHAVTEAVAHHHDLPSADAPFDGVATTYVANALVEALEADSDPSCLPPTELDIDYLEAAGVAARLPHWRQLAARQFEEDLEGR